MSFMLALPKISLHGAGAIGDMVKLVAGKQWGKALIVTDGQLVKLGLLDSLCLLYTSDAADDLLCVDLGGRRTITKKKKTKSISCLLYTTDKSCNQLDIYCTHQLSR